MIAKYYVIPVNNEKEGEEEAAEKICLTTPLGATVDTLLLAFGGYTLLHTHAAVVKKTTTTITKTNFIYAVFYYANQQLKFNTTTRNSIISLQVK